MLLGAVALFAGLTHFFSPPAHPGLDTSALDWDPANANVVIGAAEVIDNSLAIELKPSRLAVITLPHLQFAATSYPYLHIAFEQSSHDLEVAIHWKNSASEESAQSYTLENQLHESLWLATNELKGWTGEIHSLYLVIIGNPGDTVIIRDFSFFGPSLSRQLRAIYSDLTVYEPWNRAAMNSHSGVISVSSFYPVPLVVAYLALCLIAYGVLLLVFRARLQFDRKVVAIIFLACWITMDLAWQKRLLHQLADTYRTFSGMDTPEKLAVGPDAKLYKFVSEVKQRLEPENARIFVASADEYHGLRGAYYLYPFNVFWSLHGQELPQTRFMQRGDYIVAINPTETRYGPVKEMVAVPGGSATRAELVFSDPSGKLYRVK